jgi:hypothetical protein
MRRLFIAGLLSTQLIGCASYTQEFDCKAGTGVGCKLISEVNDMVNNGEIAPVKNIEIVEKSATRPELIEIAKFQKNKVYRKPEKTARILIKGFVDEKGDHIGETYVHTVIKPGTWQEGVDE